MPVRRASRLSRFMFQVPCPTTGTLTAAEPNSRSSIDQGIGIGDGVRGVNDFPSDWNIRTVRSRVGMAGTGAPDSVGLRMMGDGVTSTKAMLSGVPSSPTADTFTSACKGTSRDGRVGNTGPNATKRRTIVIGTGVCDADILNP